MRTRLGVRRTASSRFEPPLRVTVSCMAPMMAAQLADLELFGRRRRRVRHVRGELPLEVRPVVVMTDACRRVIRSRALNHPPPPLEVSPSNREPKLHREHQLRGAARVRGAHLPLRHLLLLGTLRLLYCITVTRRLRATNCLILPLRHLLLLGARSFPFSLLPSLPARRAEKEHSASVTPSGNRARRTPGSILATHERVLVGS